MASHVQVTAEAKVTVNAHTEQKLLTLTEDSWADEKLRPRTRWPEEGGGGRVLKLV